MVHFAAFFSGSLVFAVPEALAFLKATAGNASNVPPVVSAAFPFTIERALVAAQVTLAIEVVWAAALGNPEAIFAASFTICTLDSKKGRVERSAWFRDVC